MKNQCLRKQESTVFYVMDLFIFDFGKGESVHIQGKQPYHLSFCYESKFFKSCTSIANPLRVAHQYGSTLKEFAPTGTRVNSELLCPRKKRENKNCQKTMEHALCELTFQTAI